MVRALLTFAPIAALLTLTPGAATAMIGTRVRSSPAPAAASSTNHGSGAWHSSPEPC
jgi:hypothetical protein